jgi:nitrile hydratase
MNTRTLAGVVKATGEEPVFQAGDRVMISVRYPVGHYRVPRYIRGKQCVIESVIEPRALNNEEEGFGRNAGQKRHYYRVAIPLRDLWPGYGGSAADGLRIEVYESWLERI